MTTFFTLGNTNEIVLKAHSYISRIGIRIIDDKVCKGSSILENHFYKVLDLLEIVEERKDLEITDDKLQLLILRLYSIVENECLYYNSLYLDLDDPMYSGSVTIDTSDLVTKEYLDTVISELNISNQKSILDITDNSNPTVIDWQNDIAPNSTITWAIKHGEKGYVWSAKWKNNSTGNFEKNDGYSIEDLYDIDNNLQTVTINVSDIPFKFIFI